MLPIMGRVITFSLLLTPGVMGRLVHEFPDAALVASCKVKLFAQSGQASKTFVPAWLIRRFNGPLMLMMPEE